MPGPISGGIQGVKNAKMLIKANNQMVKDPGYKAPTVGKALAKKSFGPGKVVNAFMSGARNPAATKANVPQIRQIAGKPAKNK